MTGIWPVYLAAMSVTLPISASTRRMASATATAGQTAFPYTFPLIRADDIRVRRTRAGTTVTLSQSTDFTVSGVGNAAGGTVTLVAGSLAGDIIDIDGLAGLDRVTGVTSAGRFSSAQIDRDFDLALIRDQELRRDINDLGQVDVLAAVTQAQSAAAQALISATQAQTAAASVPAQATQAEAEAGTASTSYMTPLRTRQALKIRKQFNALDYGIDNTGTTDCSAAILSLIALAAGNEIYFPAGTYLLNSAIVYNGPVNIIGAGCGAGPGLFASAGVTKFLCSFANPSGFVITTLYSCLFQNFLISVNTGFRVPGSGCAISITGDVGNAEKSIIRNVSFDNFFTQIYFQRPSWHIVTECYFQNWKNDAILSETDGTREGSTGWITHNHFFGNYGDFTGVNQRSCITLRVGYTVVSENEILGGQAGINVDIINYEAGFIKIINNTIENQYYYGIKMTVSDASNASMIDITGNEFSNTSLSANYQASIFIDDAAARVWVTDITICRNIMRHIGAVGLGYIRVAAGQNINISDNVLEQVSGTASLGIGVVGVNNALSLAGSPAPCVLDNQLKGTFTSRYTLSSTVPSLLRDHQPITFANVPANCAPGSQIMVSDGKATNFLGGNTLMTSGGTAGGGPAFRTSNSTWHSYVPS